MFKGSCFAVVAALATSGCAASVAATPFATPAPFVRASVDRHVYPGISLAVGNAKGLITAQAYGYADVGRHIAITPETPLRFASVSKSIAAAAILKLDQSGAISIDKTVSTYVPNYVYGGRMTVRELLNHTSGIPGHAHGDPIIHGDGAITRTEFFARLNRTPLYAKPGTSFDYSNENYYLLALIVQKASGLRYGDFLRKRIFEPTAMNSTYADDGRANPRLALGYLHRTASDPFLQCSAPDSSNVLGGGDIISTPSDILRFDLALRGGRLLNAAHVATMFAPSVKVGAGSYALGWFVYPGNLYIHEGDFSTAAAINAIYPDGTAVVEVSNGAILSPDFDRFYFATKLQNEYGGRPHPLGTPNPPSLLKMAGPFSSCAEFTKLFFGP